jgi:hypothetical protein
MIMWWRRHRPEATIAPGTPIPDGDTVPLNGSPRWTELLAAAPTARLATCGCRGPIFWDPLAGCWRHLPDRSLCRPRSSDIDRPAR